MEVEETDARGALEEERAKLQAQLVEHGGGVQHDDNFADSGQVAAEQGENRALVGQLEETLAEVERALAKLDEGTYGTCESCGKTISEARLEAMPATRYCIDCAN
ncbi:MAG: DNA-binding protein [Acidimicrobiales bacterium]|jgi:RNA polymerase-binding protein DksA|nr:DNA-binding protein [Acidimicrobiales bacterium]